MDAPDLVLMDVSMPIMDVGYDDYLTKPVEFLELTEQL